ncbi:RecQ family ATP-dependent DNA helicase [Aliikangiella sp. IMCC44632]
MDVFHTGNYVRCHYNYRISGLAKKQSSSSVGAILSNIHFRGTPTGPSQYLRKVLKALEIEVSSDASVFLNQSQNPAWDRTILGSDSGFNPALNFYNNSLRKLLGEYAFLYPLIRPETPIDLIIQDDSVQEIKSERVDFFLPLANVVIEIDGSQHQEVAAKTKDFARDELFRKHEVRTFRLAVKNLRKEYVLQEFGTELQKYLSQLKIVSMYQALINREPLEDNLVLTSIYRLQAIIIEMIDRGMLSLNDKKWSLKIYLEADPKFAKIAIDDLFNWVHLLDGNERTPIIDLEPSVPTYTIYVYVSTRWDDSLIEGNVVTCHTDHFEYYPDGNIPRSTSADYLTPSLSNNEQSLDLSKINLRGVLNEIYNYDNFNGGQIDIIENVLQRQDTIGVLPTGGGKSLCYQLPGVLHGGLTLVICPIKSLMRDQVQELVQIGFHRSACIDSDTPTSDKERIINQVKLGKIRFLFVSPERLQVSTFRDALKSLHERGLISKVVIDEVHCLSEWGHDFRTSYLTLPNTLAHVATDVPRLCLTATASKRVLEDIQAEFDIENENVKTLAKYERKNLNFSVVKCKPVDKAIQFTVKNLQKGLISNQSAAIVFSSTVNGAKGAYSLYEKIKRHEPEVKFFTGTKPKNYASNNFEAEKAESQAQFKKNKIPLLVATKAFGMGVNKRNIYTTMHAGLPQSIEALYQEAGRAGRDGTESHCFVFYEPPTVEAYKEFFEFENYHRFCKSNLRFSGGDISTHHFFLKSSIQQNEKIPSIVNEILKALSQNEGRGGQVSSNEIGESPSDTQLALYRLYQMGVVQDWTIEDFSRGIYLVDFELRDIAYHNSIVEKIIGERCLRRENFERIKTMESWINAMKELSKMVVEHHINTRVHSRIESLKTLLYACENFDSNKPEEFRKDIESYFAIDSINDSLSDVIGTEDRIAAVLNYLSGKDTPLLKESNPKIQNRLFPMRRYLESYPNEKALILLNELFLYSLDDKNKTDSLIASINAFVPGINKRMEFLFGVKGLVDSRKWYILELGLCDNLANEWELDIFAKRVGSDVATMKIINKINPKLKTMSEKLNELI